MMKKIAGLTIVGAIVGYVVAEFKMVRTVMSEDDELPTNPVEFSLRDWKQAFFAFKHAFADKHLPVLASSVAYYSTLAFFPLLAAAVAIAALMLAPDQLQSVVNTIDVYLPKDVANLISTQLETLAGKRADNIVAAVIAIAFSLFGASGASKSIVNAANIAYGVREPRGWLRKQLRGLGWTAIGIVFGFTVASLLIVNKTVLAGIGVPMPLQETLLLGRWPVIVILLTLGLAFFYRFGPNRHHAKWQWISWGAITATALWLVGTSLFFVYVQNFGNFSKSYSFFAGIIILMMWLNLSALAILLGAAVNHGLEKAAESSKA